MYWAKIVIFYLDLLDEDDESEESEDSDLSQLCQREGRNHVAGVFATQLHKKDPSLGEYKHNLTINDGFVKSAWLEKMDGGGRKYAKETLVKDFDIWESEFEKFHESSEDGLQRFEGVTKKLIEKLSNMFPNYPLQMFKKFVMCKTIHRMTWIQQETKKKNQKTRESLRSKTRRLAYQY